MKKRFNTTGACFPDQHYMVDMTEKVNQTMKMVNRGDYFVIHRPRQYGKTTMLGLLETAIEKEGKLPVFVSFQELDSTSFEVEANFCHDLIELIADTLTPKYEDAAHWILNKKQEISGLGDLSRLFNTWIDFVNKEVVLLIDEVDKSGDHKLFIDFLGMLRAKFLKSNRKKTFSSVILSGLYDIKNLKSKIRPEADTQYNSPWNIASDFKVNMRFTPKEIGSMLSAYADAENLSLDISQIAERLYFYSAGYPFLVSRLCQIIHEELAEKNNSWTTSMIEQAVFVLLQEENTNFDNIFQKLENNADLYDMCYSMLVDGQQFTYNYYHPTIQLGILFGIFRKNGSLQIHNKIYEQFIYNYLNSKIEIQLGKLIPVANSYLDSQGNLQLDLVINRFQQFMLEEQGQKDKSFLERDARLVFLAFLTPILNGKGFVFREVQISEEKRLDVVIIYGKQRFIVELKIWRGAAYHQKGMDQIVDYLTRKHAQEGYLLIFNSVDEQKKKAKETIELEGKSIFTHWM